MTETAARAEALRFIIETIDNSGSGLEYLADDNERRIVDDQIDVLLEELNDRLHQLKESNR